MKSDDDEDKDSDEEKKGSDSEGSLDSGFGFDKKKVKGKKPVAPGKRYTKKAPQTTQGGGQGQAGQSAAVPDSAEKKPQVDLSARSVSSKGGAQSADKVTSKATLLLNSLRQVSPLALWQTPTKAKDLDAKVSKALNCLTKLEAFPDNKVCEDLAKELKPVTDRLSKWVDIINRFKLRDGPLSASSFLKNLEVCREELIAACDFLSPECVKAVLIDLGKDLAEARSSLCCAILAVLFLSLSFSV